MKKGRQMSAPRFLYCPWRVGSTLTVLRHLIVKEGSKRITIQLASFDQFSEEFRRTKPVVQVHRHELDRLGWFWKWQDAERLSGNLVLQ